MPPSYRTVIALFLSQVCLPVASGYTQLRCKTMPDDPAWPNASTWDRFNASVDGRLIRTIPIAASCHGADYDAAKCKNVQNQWHQPKFHEEYASSIMAPVFLNKSCDPFTAVNKRCIVGAYVQYSVDVATPDHVIKTLAFANKHNIRFIVKNTGHDYMGKSTGAGGLAVWMHHLTDREWIPQFTGPTYKGPAVKVHAGVIGDMLGQDAEARGQVVVAGQCPTVGFVGGYIQGGGHSVLSSLYGMAADQILEFEVITTTGGFVRASPSENADLFWALSGGVRGTYGIVWSVTVKTYVDMPATTVHVLYRPPSQDKSVLDTHWRSIGTYLTESPKYLSAGAYHIVNFDNNIFHVVILFPKKTPEEVDVLTQPWFSGLHTLNITPAITETAQHPTIRNASVLVYQIFGGEILTGTDLYGARILPKRLWESQDNLGTLFHTLREIVDGGGHIVDIAVNPTREISGNPNNAILPAFRTMHSMCIIAWNWNDTASWEEQFADTKTVTSLTSKLAKITPETGAYLNEADAFGPTWKKDFYGVNYDRLLQVKDRWDPNQVLYGTTAVGGDRWVTVDGGGLCPRT
ncbi:FAD/FMN-containing isoamyl alcohol oxidase MreA [Macrolepiota fuliginosa MF-IS2]|uniref:FAD/FMN-containing isoamyl alcohol oxidase MreA n=1 Tax=Macrolepiota fuliginosa MF-IS2 TaxID=1400762 RepID=A0A9P5XDS0_9AGAR|nr:FAD/FMN-containing isoamyl alcohol oxidase MreA [Macrolepiota fuliginosa MF-IS2]